MKTFIVTTDQDVVDAKDGKLSLREAVLEAEKASGGTKGQATVGFDKTVFATKGTVELHKTLTVDAGANIVIDGTRNPGAQVYLASDGTGFGELVRVAGGATVTVRDMVLTSNQFESSVGKSDGYGGFAGLDGSSGTDGVYADEENQLVTPEVGTDGQKGGRLDQTSVPRSPVSALRKKLTIWRHTGWSRPMRSVSRCLSSGVARGPSATLAGSPGTRKTAAYIATMTKTRIRRPRPMRLQA